MREKEMDTYCEIMIEGEIRGKTSVNKGTLRPMWTEDFEFMYLHIRVLLTKVIFRTMLTTFQSF
jgi:Ca2+-dependent lipid-binding protein